MATEKQLDANRENARRSTGPKTPEGKVHSSHNALKHGLLARDVVLPGEDPEQFQALLEDFQAELQPVGLRESRLVQQIAEADWRLRRIVRMETGFFAVSLDRPRQRDHADAADESYGISSIYSGLPFTPSSAVNTLNGFGSQRPNRIGNGTLPRSQRSLQRYFDISAFRTPGQFLFGNSGTNILFGPGTVQFDLAFAKSFYLGESAGRRFEFRSEMFNILNTPQFNNPNASMGSQQAGLINSAGSKSTFQRTSRQIHFALKFHFYERLPQRGPLAKRMLPSAWSRTRHRWSVRINEANGVVARQST